MEITHLSSLLLSFGLPILVAATMVFALVSIWNRDFPQLIIALSLGVLGVFGLVTFNNIFQRAAEEAGVETIPSPTPSAALPSTAPAAQSAPDATWLWLVLGVLGAILVIALLGFLLAGVVVRHRSSALELRERQAAVAADRAKALAVWQRSVDTHQQLRDGAVQIELDWDTVFQYPALLDPAVPSTREFHRALRAIESVAQYPPSDINLAMDISQLPYPRLVAAAEEAWTAAWSFARRTGTKLIPREERKKVDQIVKLLRMARDGGGSEHERSIAYERATKLIGELQFVRVPAASIEALGVEARLMIEAGKPSELSSDAVRTPIALKG